MKVAHEADPPVDDEIWVHLVKSGSLVLIEEDKIPFEPWSNLSNFRATIIKHFELNRAPHNVNPIKLVLKPAADGAPLRDMSMKLFAVQFHRDHNGLHIYVEVPPAQKNEKGGRVDFGGLRGGVVKSIAVSALAGLHAAHSSGILHNDVCPHNICLNDLAPGVAVLIDFGSSTVVGSYESVKTRDEYGLGRRPGSHTYDLVCLAATVYELCTTAHPSWPACEAWANSEVSPEEDPWPRRFVRHCLFSSSTAGVATALKREFPLDESLFARLWPQARGDSQQIEKDASSHPSSSSSSCSTEGKQTTQEDQEATETVFLVSTEDSHQEEAQTRRKPEVASEGKANSSFNKG